MATVQEGVSQPGLGCQMNTYASSHFKLFAWWEPGRHELVIAQQTQAETYSDPFSTTQTDQCICLQFFDQP